MNQQQQRKFPLRKHCLLVILITQHAPFSRKGFMFRVLTHPSIMSSSGQLLSSSGLRLGLVFWLVLGFVLVVYSAEQKYRWLIFLVVPIAI